MQKETSAEHLEQGLIDRILHTTVSRPSEPIPYLPEGTRAHGWILGKNFNFTVGIHINIFCRSPCTHAATVYAGDLKTWKVYLDLSHHLHANQD